MTDTVVFIPTRNRIHCLDRVLPKWQAQEVDQIFLVVEKWEVGKHKQIAAEYPNVDVLRLPKVNQGVTYSRDWITRIARGLGLQYIIMADDDLFPHPNSDVRRLFEFDGLNTIGIGIMLSFYGLTFGNDTLRERDDPLLMPNSMGKRLFSLDIERAFAAGGYDPRLHTFGGDNEIVRDAMHKLQATWYVHAGVHGTSIGKRHEPGGLNHFHEEDGSSRLQGEKECHKIIFEKWGPKYISRPPGRMICHWKKMLNDFVPDWSERLNWETKERVT